MVKSCKGIDRFGDRTKIPYADRTRRSMEQWSFKAPQKMRASKWSPTAGNKMYRYQSPDLQYTPASYFASIANRYQRARN